MFGDLLGYSQKHNFLSKTDVVTLGQLMELIGLLLFQHLVTLNERKVYGRMLSLAARNFDLKTKTFRVWSFFKKNIFTDCTPREWRDRVVKFLLS